MAEVLLLLGGNVGDVRGTQEQAMALLAERVGPLLARSREHWTEPWGFTDDRLFLNQAVLFRTALEPDEVMRQALAIETLLGRVRAPGTRYSARTMDIDLLLMDQVIMDTELLVLPHPRMSERTFVLAPAADVAPGWLHPLSGLSVLELLSETLRKA